MAWTCSKCTFINSPSQKFNCQICLSELPPSSSSLSPSSSSPSKPKWSCKACTFLNPYSKTSCEVCGTRASSAASLLSTLEDDELELVDSSVGNVFLPLKRCNKRKNGDDTVGFGDDADKIGGFLGDNSAKRKDPFGVSESVTDLGGFLGDKSAKPADHLVVRENATESGGFLGEKSTKRKEPFGVCENFTESGGFRGVKSAKSAVVPPDETQSATDSRTLRIMSYNVWFREDLEMHKRMKAIGDLIQLHCPDVICFQEVTPNIYDIFQQSSWWKIYCCSVSNEMAFTRPYFCMQLSKLPVKSYCCKPFSNSIMGRELCVAEVKVQTEIPLVVATSHLESPCPAPPKWDQMFSKERVDQAKEALNFLKTNPNVIFCGDMNWDDRLDGNFPLPDGWSDAWTELKPGETGWTYDTKSNKMLTGNRTLQKRLDRFLCSLRDFKVSGIDMIGMETIPGLQFCKEKKVKTEVRKLMLPVLPSDHYGLLLTLSSVVSTMANK